MTNPNLSDVVFILDESGSMLSLRGATVEAVNSFVNKQRAVPGDCKVTLVTFSAYEDGRTFHDLPLDPKRKVEMKMPWRVVRQSVPLADFQDLTNRDYNPNGGTALMDTVVDVVELMGQRYRALPENQRPGHVILAIQTDDEENSSRFATRAQVKELLTRQQNEWKWTVVFFAANIDAERVAQDYGIDVAMAMAYSASPEGTKGAFAATSDLVGRLRTGQNTDGWQASAQDDPKHKKVKT